MIFIVLSFAFLQIFANYDCNGYISEKEFKEKCKLNHIVSGFRADPDIEKPWYYVEDTSKKASLIELAKSGVKEFLIILEEDDLNQGRIPRVISRNLRLFEEELKKEGINDFNISIVLIPKEVKKVLKENKTYLNPTLRSFLKEIKKSYAPPSLKTTGHKLSVLSGILSTNALTAFSYYKGHLDLEKAILISIFSTVVSVLTVSYSEFRYNLAFSFRTMSENIFYKSDKRKLLSRWSKILNTKFQKENIHRYGFRAMKKLGIGKYIKKLGFDIFKFTATQGQFVFEFFFTIFF